MFFDVTDFYNIFPLLPIVMAESRWNSSGINSRHFVSVRRLGDFVRARKTADRGGVCKVLSRGGNLRSYPPSLLPSLLLHLIPSAFQEKKRNLHELPPPDNYQVLPWKAVISSLVMISHILTATLLKVLSSYTRFLSGTKLCLWWSSIPNPSRKIPGLLFQGIETRKRFRSSISLGRNLVVY